MADPLGGYVPDTVKNDEPIREPIARLGKMISDRMEVMLGKEKRPFQRTARRPF